MPDTTFIYILIDPTTEQIRYVGKTDRPGKRFSVHTTSFHGNPHKINWIKKLQKQGLKPTMHILEEVPILNWQERERYWIKFYREQDCDLLNLDDGGYGHTSLTPEHRAKIGASGKGKKRTPEQCARIAESNRKNAANPVAKAKRSMAFKGKPLSLEHRAKLSASHKARAATPEGRAEIEKMVKARPPKHSPETLAKKSATMRAKYEEGWDIGEEARAKISAAKKGIPRTPEVKARLSAAKMGKKRGPMPEAQKARLSAAKKAKPVKPNPRCGTCGRFLKKDGSCSGCSS